MYCKTCNCVRIRSVRSFPGFISCNFRIMKVSIDLRHLSLPHADEPRIGRAYKKLESTSQILRKYWCAT